MHPLSPVSTGQLLMNLMSSEADVRAAAAVELGERWKSGAPDLPPVSELLSWLARADDRNPGVADAFWVTVMYDRWSGGDLDHEQVKPWILEVLYARRDRRELTSTVPGNDLEFHAHELFDADFEALTALLSWGYADLVMLALDHGELARESSVTLLTRLCTQHGRKECGEWLALHFGVLLPTALATWPTLRLENSPARCITRDYGYHRSWTAHWVWPESGSLELPLREPAHVVQLLIEAGLPITEVEAALDPHRIAHIPFPAIPNTTRQRHAPRSDLVLDFCVDTATEGLVALRLVRARRHA